jgi:hypothetical protein
LVDVLLDKTAEIVTKNDDLMRLEREFLLAVIYYLWKFAPPEESNVFMLVVLCQSALDIDDDRVSDLTRLFNMEGATRLSTAHLHFANFRDGCDKSLAIKVVESCLLRLSKYDIGNGFGEYIHRVGMQNAVGTFMCNTAGERNISVVAESHLFESLARYIYGENGERIDTAVSEVLAPDKNKVSELLALCKNPRLEDIFDSLECQAYPQHLAVRYWSSFKNVADDSSAVIRSVQERLSFWTAFD